MLHPPPHLQATRRSSACPDRVFRSSQNHPTKEFKAFRYIIIGAGSAATAAVKAIREIDQDGEVFIFPLLLLHSLILHLIPKSQKNSVASIDTRIIGSPR